MWRWILLVATGLFVVGIGLWATLVVSIRTQFRPVLDAVRRMNRRFTNPRVMRTAGKPGASASVIHHVGRSSGTPYATPVGLMDTEAGYVITLPYGTSPDWLKNVQAAGSAVIDTEGRTYTVTDPRIVRAADVDRYFSGKDRRSNRIYGVDRFLVLKRVGAGDASGGSQ